MDGKVIIGTELDTKSFDEQITQTENRLNRLEKAYQKAMNPPKGTKANEQAIENLKLEIEKTTNKLADLRTKQAKLGETPPNGVLEWLKNVGKETEKNVKKVTSWALAIFGIRGAYMAVRNAMNVITAQDKQLSADITYMKNAIAYTLEPVIRGIVNLMKQLMFYVAYIVKAWTGKNIFANANKGLKSATGSAKALNKELNKTIAGFDEMNVINDTPSGGGGDAGGAGLPSFDLTNLEDIPIPSWLQWIVDNKDEVIATLAGIAAGIIAINMGANGFLALGIGLIVYGIVKLIEDVLKFIKDPSWENFANILEDLTVILLGVALAMAVVNAANPTVWIILLIALLTFLVAEIIKHWEEIKGVLIKVGKWIYDNIIKPISDFFSWLWERIVDGFSNAIKWVKEKFNGLVSFFGKIIDKIIGFFTYIGTTVGDVIGGAFKGVINGVLGAIETILNSPIRAVNKLINTINDIPGISLNKLSTFKLPRLAKGGIVNNPGPGVMMGSYVAGEQGPEAVLPLTDEVLDRLGEAIARHQNINATIPVYVGNRQIARELRKINAEDNFAFNN